MPGSLFNVNADMGIPPAPADAMSKANVVPSVIGLYNSSTLDLIRSVIGDTQAATGILASLEMLFNGATYDRRRTPNVFKIVAAQAITAATGITAWDPASGKKFRMMGYCLSVSAAASLIFYEGLTTALTTALFRSPLLAIAGIHSMGVGDLGNGILSSTANMNLNLDVSATATVTGTIWGTEE